MFEYNYLIDDINRKRENLRMTMSSEFKNLYAKVQTSKSILLELKNGLTKFSKTRTASGSIAAQSVESSVLRLRTGLGGGLPV